MNHPAPTLLFAIITAMSGATLAKEPEAAKPTLNCATGPLTKTYGGTQWLVYACSDDRSVVFVTAPENPGSPFYFMLTPQGSSYRLYGEGTGAKKITDAAFGDLSKLLEPDVASLIAAAKKLPKQQQRP